MQVRKSHIVKNDARMYYGNICNSFIHLILYHIVALGENEYEIMEDQGSPTSCLGFRFLNCFQVKKLNSQMLTSQMESGNDGYTGFLERKILEYRVS